MSKLTKKSLYIFFILFVSDLGMDSAKNDGREGNTGKLVSSPSNELNCYGNETGSDK